MKYEGKEYLLKENDGFLIDCRKAHSYQTKGAYWEHSDFHFTGGISSFLYTEHFQQQTPMFHCPNESSYQKQLEYLLRIQTGSHSRRDFLFSMETERMLAMVLDYMDHQQETELPDNIRLLQSYLEKHFAEDMSLDAMALFAGMSKYHLCREFKKHTRFSPKQYVLHLRLLQARILLQTTDIPGYRIGMLVGFKSEAGFIRQFKESFNMTPNAYRNQFR